MIRSLTLLAAVALIAGAAAAQTTAPATDPATKPAADIQVGSTTVTAADVETKVAKALPADASAQDRQKAQEQLTNEMILRELYRQYVASKNIAVSDEELQAEKEARGITDENIRLAVAMKKLIEPATAPEKVEAFIAANPDYFNGTKVQASHILLACPPTAPTATQREMIARLQAIAADINAGKTSFEDAAKEFSTCPSSVEGGALGEFGFGPDQYGRGMAMPFSKAAFALKEGEVSPVVRTEFGFHLIKVTKRTPDTQPASPAASQVAMRAILADIESELMNQTLTSVPIVEK